MPGNRYCWCWPTDVLSTVAGRRSAGRWGCSTTCAPWSPPAPGAGKGKQGKYGKVWKNTESAKHSPKKCETLKDTGFFDFAHLFWVNVSHLRCFSHAFHTFRCFPPASSGGALPTGVGGPLVPSSPRMGAGEIREKKKSVKTTPKV